MTHKIHKILNAAIVITVALAFIMPGAAIFTNKEKQEIIKPVFIKSDWVMEIENKSVNPGDTDVIIHVNGSWAEDIGAFGCAGYYDASKIEIVDIDWTEGAFKDSLLLQEQFGSDESLVEPGVILDWFNIGWVYMPGIDPGIPANDTIMFKFIVNVNSSAGDCVTVFDLRDALSEVPGGGGKASVFTILATGDSASPDLTDGIITIGSPNTPPDAPVNEGPGDGATDVSIYPTLSVSVSDPDGDTMDVNFYVNDVLDTTIADVGSGDIASLIFSEPFEYGTTYDWYVIADDGEDSTQSDTWSFTTINAYDLTVNIVGSGSVDLDPDGGTYEDGTTVELTATADSGWEFIGWSGDLTGDTNPETIVMDADKEVTATFEEMPAVPDLKLVSADLDWIDVEPSSTVTGEIIIENDGDPGSLLDWEIDDEPTWGTFSFDPESGTDITGQATIDVEVVAPADEETEFTGTIKIVNSEDSSDFIEIDVSLATPLVKNNIQNLFVQFLEQLFERFPILEILFSALIA